MQAAELLCTLLSTWRCVNVLTLDSGLSMSPSRSRGNSHNTTKLNVYINSDTKLNSSFHVTNIFSRAMLGLFRSKWFPLVRTLLHLASLYVLLGSPLVVLLLIVVQSLVPMA